MSFTLRDLITEKQYNILVDNFKDESKFKFDVILNFNNQNLNQNIKKTAKYYRNIIPHVYYDRLNSYTSVDSNLEKIVESIKETIKTYKPIFSYEDNNYLDVKTFDGEINDYEFYVSEKLIKITKYDEYYNSLNPYKEEVIIEELDYIPSKNNLIFYNILSEFNEKRNEYFLTTFEMFKEYMLRKIKSNNKTQLDEVKTFLSNLTDKLNNDLYNTDYKEIFVKVNVDENLSPPKISDIEDFVIKQRDEFKDYFYNDSIKGFEDEDGNVFLSWNSFNKDILRFDYYDEYLTTNNSDDLDKHGNLEISYITSGGEYDSEIYKYYIHPFTFGNIESIIDDTTIEIDPVDESKLEIGKVIYDKTESNIAKITDINELSGGIFELTLDRNFSTSVDNNIEIYEENLTQSEINLNEQNKQDIIEKDVSELSTFIFDFNQDPVTTIDLNYYIIGIEKNDNDEYYDVNNTKISDKMIEYILMEQDKIVDKN